MKKRIFVITFLVSLAAVSVALAAVSSPCGARKPVKREAPPRVDEKYRRDVLDFRVPVETAKEGNIDRSKATEDRERLAP
jgi:hypothetical protein